MNKLLHRLWLPIVAVAMSALAACGSSSEVDDGIVVTSDYIVVDANISIGANNTVALMQVNANCHWSFAIISQSGDWQGLQFSATEGTNNTNVNIETPKNDKTDDRTVIIEFTNDDQSFKRQVTITQTAGDFDVELSVDPTQIDMVAEGGTTSAMVDCNTEWTAEVETTATWCVIDKVNGVNREELHLTVQPNQSNQERRALVTIASGNRTGNRKQQVITVIQSAAPLPSPIVLSATVADDNKSVTVQASFQSMYDVTDYGYSYRKDSEASYQEAVVGSNGGKQNNFSFTINNVEDGRTYYIRTYATSVVGTGWSTDYTITIPGDIPGNGDNTSPNLARENK